MAQYTVLSDQNIRSIIATYNLGELHSFKILSGGSENTNYLVVTQSGKYVMTICEQKSAQEAGELANLLEHLAYHNFSTSKIVRNSTNEAIALWNGKPVMVKTFLEGKIIEDLPENLVVLLGRELGRLHQIEAPEYLPKIISYGKEHFYEVENYAPNSQFNLWLYEVRDYIEKHISPNLPKALIHSDLFYNNIIVSDDERSATIMDFEEATYYYRVFDLGMTVIGVCAIGETIDLAKASSLMKGYTEETNLTKTEWDCLKAFTVYAAASMSFWRHKNFNYTNPEPKLKDHYLALKNLADYTRELPDDCFQEFN